MTQWGLDTLFNPAKRHMDEEKRRLLSTREQLGDSSGGKRIDLESGKVRISKSDKPEDVDETDDAVDAVDEPAAEKSKRALSPAQIRAAERRGRKPRAS